MIPLITVEVSFRQQVCELVLGVNMFDLDFGVQSDSVKQPNKRDSGFVTRIASLDFGFTMIIFITAPLSSKTESMASK